VLKPTATLAFFGVKQVTFARNCRD